MKIFICGLGRIGRHALRFLDERFDIDIEFYDKLENIDNLVYLLNYDSVYGLRKKIYESSQNKKSIINKETQKEFFFCHPDSSSAQLAIDCSGSPFALEELVASNFKKIYVTNSTENKLIDDYTIANVSDSSKKRVISVSICDTTAIAPVLKFVDEKFDILNGHLTTLHPWLNYQNLSDGPVLSTQTPSSYLTDFALGRKSTEALIPKTTTAINALEKVFPDLANKFSSWSFRVPTPIVSVALLNINTNNEIQDPKGLIKGLLNVRGIAAGGENKVSSDYIGLEANCAIDVNSLLSTKYSLSISLYYDNELGYTSQILNHIINFSGDI